MIISIHQPDFMPWPGFFVKMLKSDTMVILDHTLNNPRDAASWLRRVRIAVNGGQFWFSIPLQKVDGSVGTPINEIKIATSITNNNFENNLKTIRINYCKTPGFSKIFPIIEHYFSMNTDSLCERNMFFIETVKEGLGIETKLVYSSSLQPRYKSTPMLIDLLEKLHAKVYLCGDGAADYMDVELFRNKNINIEYNNFIPPRYMQVNTKQFVGSLSIIDSLMNLGFAGVSELLNNLVRKTQS